MIVIRPVTRNDVDFFKDFSFDAMLGITTLPRDPLKLKTKFIHSEKSFHQQIVKPGPEEYYFVLEDLTTGCIGGVCGIFSQSTRNCTYFYHVESTPTNSKHPSVAKEMTLLKVNKNPAHTSEVGSLYLQPSFRHSGLGRLLSLSRFLFIAAHRQRFEKKIIAEMRGFIQDTISPFWESIGRHFCNLSYVELMNQLEIDRSFVEEILPKFPIYVGLLPKETQDILGKTHDSSKPALNMLLQENFVYNHEIDILDAGPHLECKTAAIRTIKNSALAKIQITTEPLTADDEYLLSNENINFRACLGRIRLLSKSKILINLEVAKALLMKEGDQIRYVTLH